MSLVEKCRRVEMILSDVDGVMTDGGVMVDAEGERILRFYIRDGLGVTLWIESGKRFGLVTGNIAKCVRIRAEQLSINPVRQGVRDKLPVVDEIIAEAKLTREQICYIGDDLPDLPVIREVGLGVAVADAAEEVRAVADYRTSTRGGHGAVRETIELIMRNSGAWDTTLEEFV